MFFFIDYFIELFALYLVYLAYILFLFSSLIVLSCISCGFSTSFHTNRTLLLLFFAIVEVAAVSGPRLRACPDVRGKKYNLPGRCEWGGRAERRAVRIMTRVVQYTGISDCATITHSNMLLKALFPLFLVVASELCKEATMYCHNTGVSAHFSNRSHGTDGNATITRSDCWQRASGNLCLGRAGRQAAGAPVSSPGNSHLKTSNSRGGWSNPPVNTTMRRVSVVLALNFPLVESDSRQTKGTRSYFIGSRRPMI